MYLAAVVVWYASRLLDLLASCRPVQIGPQAGLLQCTRRSTLSQRMWLIHVDVNLI
jgi:hypothetical protein